jgi:hypothetical protein
MNNRFEITSSSSSSSSDDSDDDSNDSVFELCLLSIELATRKTTYYHLRTSWEHHATMLVLEKKFDSNHRMSYESFMHLKKLLEPDLWKEDCKSINSFWQLAISPPHILGLTVWWLSCSPFHDIRDAGNFS